MCKTHFLTVCCHGNGILWQKWGENLTSRTTSSVFHQFSWNLAQMFAFGCRCARHIFWSGRKCVAMVTAYYTVKKYCGAGVLITFSDISSCRWQIYIKQVWYVFFYINSSIENHWNLQTGGIDQTKRDKQCVAVTHYNTMMVLLTFRSFHAYSVTL